MSFFGFFVLASIQASVAFGSRLDITKDSLLLYLDELKDRETRINVTSEDSKSSNLANACRERSHTSTVYYRMLYFRFCPSQGSNQSNIAFEQFCLNLNAYFEDHKHQLLNKIEFQATKNRIFGPGIESSQLWLAHRTCGYVKDYFEQKAKLTSNTSNENNHVIRQPNYTEWFIHTIPFSLPVACGFTKQFYDKQKVLSISHCVPFSSKAALFFILVLDAVIFVIITGASVLILLATPKLKIASTPHG